MPDFPTPATGLESRIADHARHLGFDAVGFCKAELGPEVAQGLREFVAQGHHGTMEWMETRIEERAHPQALWPEVRSVISLGLSYAPAEGPTTDPECGNISVYARNRDYHDVIKGMLKHLAQYVVKLGGPDTQVKVFVDTAPVSERALAEKAQLGWTGKHTCLVSREHGSWLLLGEIYTTLELAPSVAKGGSCGSCTRCLTACPTDAFTAPYRMDARRCISYLTIEHKGPIPHDLRPKIGNHIYGCDDCLSVCPWNRFAESARHIKLQARPELVAPKLEELVRLDDATFRTFFSGSPIKRIGRNRFVRNVLIAIGNSADPSLLPAAQGLLADPDPDIAETADWAIKQLEDHPRMSDLVKRSLSLSGHRTSVALEPEFWTVLDMIATTRQQSFASLVASLDATRPPERPLASALRVAALLHLQKRIETSG